MDVDVNKAAEALSTSTVINGDRLEALMKKLLLGGNIVIEYEDEEGERQQDVLVRTSLMKCSAVMCRICSFSAFM